jgi:hypothetical protein
MRKTWDPDDREAFVPSMNEYVVRPGEVRPGDNYGYKIIACVWENYWCAYRGPTTWSDEHVANSGNMVDQVTAEKMFPTLAKLGLSYHGC